MIAGPNGLGKSTLLNLLERLGVPLGIYVNADEIEKDLKRDGFSLKDYAMIFDAMVSAFNQIAINTSDTKKLSEVVSISTTYIKVKDGVVADSYISATIAEALRRALLDTQTSYTFETVMSHPSKLDLLKEATDKGFRVYTYFLATRDPQINVDRVRNRVAHGGHNVDTQKIIDRYYRALEIMPKAVKLSNRAYLFDNSQANLEAEWVAEWDGQYIHQRSDKLPGWLKL